MSFSELVAKLLNDNLGPYIEGFDAKNIELSVLSGNATMKNLELKKSALESFNLPVEIKKGYIGNISLHLPWTNLANESATILLEDIFLVVQPVQNQEFTPEELAIRAQKKQDEFAWVGQTDWC